MATYIVTTSNWNDPAFWNAISESGPGHTLDFSALPSSYSIDFYPAGNAIQISDGSSTFSIGDADFGGGANATLGGSTQLDYFTTVIGGDGSDTIDGGANDDTINGQSGSDLIEGDDGNDIIHGGDGFDTLLGGNGNDTLFGGLNADLLIGGDDALALGLSGPAILQISSYWQHGKAVHLNLLPDMPPGWLSGIKRAAPRSHLQTALAQHLPKRLGDAIATRMGQDRELGNVADRKLDEIERQLANWSFQPTGTEGYAKAEVTAGGIDTAALSSRTMEAQSVPGLFAIGEAVDVTGWLGGYNFQWAWASAWAAGQDL